MPNASCQRKSSRLPYTNLGSGAAGKASGGPASERASASEDALANRGSADGDKRAFDNLGEAAAAEVFAKSSATLAFACEETMRSSCARMMLVAASTSTATKSSLFIFFPSEG